MSQSGRQGSISVGGPQSAHVTWRDPSLPPVAPLKLSTLRETAGHGSTRRRVPQCLSGLPLSGREWQTSLGTCRLCVRTVRGRRKHPWRLTARPCPRAQFGTRSSPIRRPFPSVARPHPP
ncbi:hypothetical protein NDU88_003564 [Pleurodeles waltl]|uniref:Uncharacterized protein n=1 Tax=Pleurodeles waltl TaxID=8319 RepID=A0AAV7L6A8_PLEWA|nr:hypothetical protein NDU88_003564 [Pleurodeles waltl]